MDRMPAWIVQFAAQFVQPSTAPVLNQRRGSSSMSAVSGGSTEELSRNVLVRGGISRARISLPASQCCRGGFAGEPEDDGLR